MRVFSILLIKEIDLRNNLQMFMFLFLLNYLQLTDVNNFQVIYNYFL